MQIEKKKVDDYQSRYQDAIAVPHCELAAEWIHPEQYMEPLIHRVNILGTTSEEKFFTININHGLRKLGN